MPAKQRYVALLRAINVGGRTIVKMPDLRRVFEACGLTDVATYIQTGNVVFSTTRSDRDRLARQLEKAFESATGYRTTIFVLTRSELQRAAANNSLEPERLDGEQHCHLMFLSKAPDSDHRKALMALGGDEYRFHVRGKVFYHAYSRDAARRRSIDFEKVLGATGTTRTWKVIRRLIEMSAPPQRGL